MTMKRMKHPLHGFHHPLSGGELTTMLANGWTVDDEPVAPKADAEAGEPDEAPAKPARGRKPKADAEAGE